MMRRSRTILTLAIMATVLCADRTLTMAAEVRPQVMETARQVVRQLGERFRSRAPATRCLFPSRLSPHQDPTSSRIIETVLPTSPYRTLTQLPLPPPQS